MVVVGVMLTRLFRDRFATDARGTSIFPQTTRWQTLISMLWIT